MMKARSYNFSVDAIATGLRIVNLCEARGYTVRDLQAFFGFAAPQAIYKWMSGKSMPNLDNLIALSYLLRVPLDDIVVRKANSADTAERSAVSFLLVLYGFLG